MWSGDAPFAALPSAAGANLERERHAKTLGCLWLLSRFMAEDSVDMLTLLVGSSAPSIPVGRQHL